MRYIRAMVPRTYVSDAPYTRAARWVTDADNETLCAHVMEAARTAWPHIKFPPGIARADVPRTVHQFVKDNVRYIREDGDQLTRMPWRTLEDGHGDCKSFAVLVASLCRAAGCDVVIRFVQYPGEDHYGHVYTIVDGVPVDPEITYGTEVNYSSKTDRRL